MDRKLVVGAAALALFSGLMWAAFLGWDHEYYLVDGVAQGPYRPWQVVGAGFSVALAAMLTYSRFSQGTATVLLPIASVVGFAIPWGWEASRLDETGMWGVGLFAIVIGGGMALSLVLLAMDATREAALRVRSRGRTS